MKSLRHLLLVVVLLLAQLAAGAHAVEHATQDGKPGKHACELCLAAHDLGSALPSLLVLPPLLARSEAPDVTEIQGRVALPPPLARQRDPPTA